jgi:hypothetical protein
MLNNLNKCLETAKTLDVDEEVPRVARKQQHRDNMSASSVEE